MTPWAAEIGGDTNNQRKMPRKSRLMLSISPQTRSRSPQSDKTTASITEVGYRDNPCAAGVSTQSRHYWGT